MKIWPEAIGIVKGDGVYLEDENGNRYIDAISSWWVTLHGHAHPHIAAKVSKQLSTLEQCIFAGFTHEPAVQLAERLLPILPGDMARIFYSDNGSTAVEVAIKMALQYWNNKGTPRKKIISLENAYHGDTFGAMAVSGRSIFTHPFNGFLFDVSFIPFPDEENAALSISTLSELVAAGDVAAFIVEPLLQGTAGMLTYTPDVLEQYFNICREHGTLIIADEVLTGFGRTGPLFACNNVNAKPDMVCLSKGLTGGTMPMGVTACTQDIFDAFYDDDKLKTLYHGHSYTANPLACTAGLASLDLLLTDDCTNSRQMIHEQHQQFAEKIKDNKSVLAVRCIGTIIAIELNTGTTTSYQNNKRDLIYRFFLERNVLMRPLGNIIYILPPYCITAAQLQYIYTCIEELFNTLTTWNN